MRRIERWLFWALIVITSMIAGQVPGVDREIEALAQEAAHPDVYEAYHALEGRFVARDDGVVVDTKTGLEWFVGPDTDTTWDEAKSWVESLPVDSGEWRMPTRDELSSLYSKGAGSHNHTPLLKTTGGYVWTGETVGSSYAWGFCFDIGDAYWPRRTYSETARAFAVRSMER